AFAGSTPNSIVSFGNESFTRQLQNVGAGRVSETSTDAINGSQLHDVALEAQKHTTIKPENDNITVTEGTNDNGSKNYTIGLNSNLINKINNLSSDTSSIRNIINANQKEAHKGIAGSAALAGLHPLDFDSDHKLDVMAGYGHYHNANAVAIGVAYRPNEDLMITVGSTVNGDDDTVYNAGISYKLGAKSTVSRSRMAMARDLADAKRQIDELQADNEKIKSILNSVLGLDDTQLSKLNH
uniref:YadA-like family protein n=1 Tax=uncultured Veillonella sp. TaxID=159268 RepID=UPI0028E6D504